MNVEDFSRRQTLDLETAMSEAICRHLREATFPGPPGAPAIQLARVFEDWPSYEDSQLSPSACVLPDAPLVYDEAYPEPFLIEETWEPRGRPGFGIYALSEARRDLEMIFRAATAAERDALKAGVETTFFGAGLSALPGPNRYGVILTMREYFGMPVRVSIAESRKLDDADKAIRNAWDFSILLRAQAKHVKVAPVQPFSLKIREEVE